MNGNRRGMMALALLLAGGTAHAGRWTEEDFEPRPVVAFSYAVGGELRDVATVVGMPRPYTFRRGDTLHDVARHLGLGINEVQAAMPDVEVWLPPEGQSRHFPTWWVLPQSDHPGVVINIPEMRLYYYPADMAGTVVTYAVGLGRDEWQTPIGHFKVSEKTVNPTWVIPDSIREERAREKGRFERVIAGGAPDNPLGRYRMRLTLPLYGIHGTNIPWGVGMKVSHGCVRLYPEDIERLFPLVPVGTPGEFVYQPVKIGARSGHVFIEVHDAIYDEQFDYWNEARTLLAERGWEDRVDWGRLAEAIDRKSGAPTRISGAAFSPSVEPAGVSEARRRYPGMLGEAAVARD
ncbi:MAG: L,D-transpeptidase family protein [Candidatus Binatia bacterium]